MRFIIKALNHLEFVQLFEKSDMELGSLGAKRMFVDEKPGYPCRVSLEDAEIGEEVILVSYEFHKANSPYKAVGPIFVRKGLETKVLRYNEIPTMLKHRLLSFRGYNKDGIMKVAKTENGIDSQTIIEQIFDNPLIEYIHIHNASPGCYNCEVRRV
ncbi:DUF1203 domain-containing protein [Geojedonia litorea]|uniref:DUF1203 domain-containing protein n=1 Tax=Geojedonia litorea TaxID=1268269 RepID=A0ABV9N2Q3_9FLAO